MHTLLTGLDAGDPFAPGPAGDDVWRGSTLTLLAERTYDAVVLLHEPADHARAGRLAAEVAARHPSLGVERLPVACGDLSLPDLLAFVRDDFNRRRAEAPAAHWTACIGAGAPVLRSAWLALADREPALALVDVLPRRYASGPAACVVDVAPPSTARTVREPAVAYHVQAPDVDATLVRARGAAGVPDIARVRRQLRVCGEDPAFLRVLETAAAVAPHPAPVLIEGETGTGKGLLARYIHALSGREPARFVAVNCAALPENLVESILFGHRKGAFTGAASDQPGKFELADGGTLFLDEIGELATGLQAKLLKVLEDGVVEPLGASRGRPVRVRVVAATNRDLKAAVAKKEFREDLYYRLSFARMALPPLRERRGDIHHLALQVLDRINESLREPRRLSPAALRRLEQLDWPGNIRDLENVIGRSVLLSSKPVLDAADLLVDPPAAAEDPLSGLPTPREGFSIEDYLSAARRQLILRALEIARGNQSAAARLLGVTPQAVHKFVQSTDA